MWSHPKARARKCSLESRNGSAPSGCGAERENPLPRREGRLERSPLDRLGAVSLPNGERGVRGPNARVAPRHPAKQAPPSPHGLVITHIVGLQLQQALACLGSCLPPALAGGSGCATSTQPASAGLPRSLALAKALGSPAEAGYSHELGFFHQLKLVASNSLKPPESGCCSCPSPKEDVGKDKPHGEEGYCVRDQHYHPAGARATQRR